jgi:tRNA A37 threonylcarbamoyladenosine biosynthesis protein TsaE
VHFASGRRPLHHASLYRILDEEEFESDEMEGYFLLSSLFANKEAVKLRATHLALETKEMEVFRNL